MMVDVKVSVMTPPPRGMSFSSESTPSPNQFPMIGASSYKEEDTEAMSASELGLCEPNSVVPNPRGAFFMKPLLERLNRLSRCWLVGSLAALTIVVAIIFVSTLASGPRKTSNGQASTQTYQNASGITNSPSIQTTNTSPTSSPSSSMTHSTSHPTTVVESSPPTISLQMIPVDANITLISNSTNTQEWPSDSLPKKTITYSPGKLTHLENGLFLSEGLRSRIIAQSGEFVTYQNGANSTIPFHGRPDAGATFAEIRASNQGGWVYVSNSEMRLQDEPGGTGNGGVGAITFDKDGNILKYEMILTNTTWNCGGGKSPWNTWISCEENPKTGQLYQVSPFGLKEPEVLTLGKDGGRFESFAYDVRDRSQPKYFVTEDHEKGALQRFIPDTPDWDNPWTMLHANGTTDYLLLKPKQNTNGGTLRWTSDKANARNNAKKHYPNTEGIDCHEGFLYFVSKEFKSLYVLDLDKGTYVDKSTVHGLFDGTPDQLQRVMANNDEGSTETEEILYFTEEAGKDAGVHGRNQKGEYFTILESPVYNDETTGLAFSPDNMHMFLAYQVNGLLFDVYREDQQPFNAKTLSVKYHMRP